MDVIRGLHNLVALKGGCVLTVGNYDGLHRGHQQIIDRVKARAAELKCAATLLSFEPSSKEFLDPASAPPRLTRWREKFLELKRLGLDRFITLRFDERMRGMSADEFGETVIVEALGTQHVVVGHDFHYGCRGAGTIETLTALGEKRGFAVEQIEPFVHDGLRVSSTAVRACLARGDCAGAARLLGRPFSMVGRVIRGAQLGRTLGFATANIALKRNKLPLWGVFAVWVRGITSSRMPGVASVGTRPTVNAGEPLLEVHLFDFDGDLYGRTLEVEFVAKLRDEVKFESVDALMAQMKRDAATARDILATTGE
jgi:riboflavin kinase / FMN adenylyltransferase